MKATLATAVLGAMVVTGCGSGTNKRLVTRPDDYHKFLAFPSSGNPVDIKAIEAEFPELKGIVMTAPEYIEEFERLRKESEAKGSSILEYRIAPGARLAIYIEDEKDLSTTIDVPPTGEWYFPFGKVRLEGMTIDGLKAHLEERLRAYGLKKPAVTVNLLAGSPRVYAAPGGNIQSTEGSNYGSIIVLGIVSTSNFYTTFGYTGNETLVSILGRTGLPGQAEWRQIRVIRLDAIDPLRKSRVIICDMWNFIALADVRQDIPLFPGDVVYVPQKWTLGDQFQKDWSLIKGFMGDAFTIDGFIDAFKKGGAFRTP
ncbi:MAG: polysaccharide biosynthesis/export family protein [Planctomycetes bacterium]|nr:polysaccharide biosynthesis/export family protein [Planctomycetota bacterium]